MKVKELDKTVNVAWSPPAQHPILLATGTAAQQLDASFSTSASLELHALNLGEPGLDMQLQVSAPSDQRFHKVVWGTNGAIVGGCDDGLVQIYDSQKLLSGEKNPVARQDKHTGPVRALDFNPFQANLLATGASDSEIFIWDLNNIMTPMSPGAKSQPAEDVAWISWNRQVQHILASTFAQRCVVWDLRKNEPIIKLSDSQSRIRWKVVSWHPEVATQLCLASEEDSASVIQLWDLRFATAPIRSLEYHQRGVLSIAWCMQDPDLLLSCGKDNRILCWNPNANVPNGEVVCEVATTTQWNFDVAWCPRNPALMSSCSFDGHVSVYSLTGGTQQEVTTSNKIADSFPGMDNYVQATPPQQAPVKVDLRKPPKWLRRPCGASFGFGGKLVTFEYDRSAAPQAVASQQPGFSAPPIVQRMVKVHQVVTEEALMSRAQALDVALQQGDYLDFCRNRSSSGCTKHEQFLWECLRTNFEPNPSREILSLLGFDPEEINNKLNKCVGRQADGTDGVVDDLGEKLKELSSDPQDAFDSIAATAALDKKPETTTPFKICTGDDPDGLICQALLLGNIEAAVELCLQDGRSADAIILAMTGGPELLARTQHRYFQKSKGYLSSLMAAAVTEDWSHVIASCDLESWKEALAAALTHTRGDEFSRLCEQLGHRLEREANGIHREKAQLCYAVAGNLHKLVETWMACVKPSTSEQLQDLVEMVAVLRTAVELKGRSVDISGSLAGTLSQYAELLASQGSLASALSYLSNSQDEHILMLRDRLSVALGYKPLHTQPQQTGGQRRASTQSQRGAATAPTGRQAPYYYGQGGQPQQNFPQTQASFPTVPFNQAQPPQGPVQPVSKAFSNMPGLPPVQPLTGVPPLQTQPAMPGPSPSPGLPRAPSVTGGSSGRKYVLDPSVQSGPTSFPSASSGYASMGNPIGQGMNPVHSQPQPSLFNPSGFVSQPDIYNPTASAPAPVPPPILAPTSQPPPGWNDPPAVKNAPRQQVKTEFSQPAPITHPLFGAVPQDQAPPLNNMNGGYIDPSGGYGAPPPPPNMYQPPNVYQAPGQMMQPQMMQPQVMQPQGMQPQVMQPQVMQPQEQMAPTAHVSRVKPEPPRPKAPLPEEHAVVQRVFDELRNRCYIAANNAQSKRKLDDVSKKLEALYDALRDQRLSANTLQSLHELVQMVQEGDYTGGLGLHTQLVSGPDFSQISSFMPGLKVLLQSALQLSVYLQ